MEAGSSSKCESEGSGVKPCTKVGKADIMKYGVSMSVLSYYLGMIVLEDGDFDRDPASNSGICKPGMPTSCLRNK